MGCIANNLSDFPVAMLDDADIAALSRNDNHCRDGIISVFLFFNLTM
jgi:hypothetical protein